MKLFNKSRKLSGEEIDKFVHESLHELIDRQDNNIELYGLATGRWDMDLEKGTITFTHPDKIVTANVQVIGTLNREKQTFMWGWDHVSIPKELSKHALLLKKWGEENGIHVLTTHVINCNEERAWEFTAVAVRLAKADGAYIGRGGTTFPFVTLTDFKVTKL